MSNIMIVSDGSIYESEKYNDLMKESSGFAFLHQGKKGV